jgi:hypothetical protein
MNASEKGNHEKQHGSGDPTCLIHSEQQLAGFREPPPPAAGPDD